MNKKAKVAIQIPRTSANKSHLSPVLLLVKYACPNSVNIAKARVLPITFTTVIHAGFFHAFLAHDSQYNNIESTKKIPK